MRAIDRLQWPGQWSLWQVQSSLARCSLSRPKQRRRSGTSGTDFPRRHVLPPPTQPGNRHETSPLSRSEPLADGPVFLSRLLGPVIPAIEICTMKHSFPGSGLCGNPSPPMTVYSVPPKRRRPRNAIPNCHVSSSHSFSRPSHADA